MKNAPHALRTSILLSLTCALGSLAASQSVIAAEWSGELETKLGYTNNVSSTPPPPSGTPRGSASTTLGAHLTREWGEEEESQFGISGATEYERYLRNEGAGNLTLSVGPQYEPWVRGGTLQPEISYRFVRSLPVPGPSIVDPDSGQMSPALEHQGRLQCHYELTEEVTTGIVSSWREKIYTTSPRRDRFARLGVDLLDEYTEQWSYGVELSYEWTHSNQAEFSYQGPVLGAVGVLGLGEANLVTGTATYSSKRYSSAGHTDPEIQLSVEATHELSPHWQLLAEISWIHVASSNPANRSGTLMGSIGAVYEF